MNSFEDHQFVSLSSPFAFAIIKTHFHGRGHIILTTSELKKHNRHQVYQIIYEHRTIAITSITSALHLSFPTISQLLTELEEDGLVSKTGFFQSTGGRKPSIFSCVDDARISLGIELIKEYFQIAATDLYGKILFEEIYHIPFINEESYFLQFGDIVQTFITDHKIPVEKILGIGIALQGLVSCDKTAVTYGAILKNNDLTVDRFQKYLDYPLMLIHDSEAAATDALWNFTAIKDALFLSLSRNIGGAMVIDRQIHQGTFFPSGLFEHMTLIPDGAACYCGKRGCLEAYCSVRHLLEGMDPTLDLFFTHLREGEPFHQIRWNQFLLHLSIAIDNLQMALNCDVIIGGHLAPYLNQEDLNMLTLLVTKDSAFNQGRPPIHLFQNSCIARGAALYQIRQFIDSI